MLPGIFVGARHRSVQIGLPCGICEGLAGKITDHQRIFLPSQPYGGQQRYDIIFGIFQLQRFTQFDFGDTDVTGPEQYLAK